MFYLITQISFILLIFFTLGFLLGRVFYKMDKTASDNKKMSDADITPVREYEASPENSAFPNAANSGLSLPAAAPSPDTKVDLEAEGFDIETLSGADTEIGQRLRQADMQTVKAFLYRARLPEQREYIARIIGVSREETDLWAGMADLMRIEGMRVDIAKVFYQSGIRTTKALGHSDALDLKAKTAYVLEGEAEETAFPLTQDEISDLITEAKLLKPFIRF